MVIEMAELGLAHDVLYINLCKNSEYIRLFLLSQTIQHVIMVVGFRLITA